MREYLGLDTRGNYRDGCMQDIHWAIGLVGYFPSYTLGAMCAAQYFAAIRRAVPDLDARILDALQGDASLFTRADEVEEAWSLIDPIIDAWAGMDPPAFPNYDAGTWGPTEADELLARDGRRWRRI